MSVRRKEIPLCPDHEEFNGVFDRKQYSFSRQAAVCRHVFFFLGNNRIRQTDLSRDINHFIRESYLEVKFPGIARLSRKRPCPEHTACLHADGPQRCAPCFLHIAAALTDQARFLPLLPLMPQQWLH
jgi:hypothetical protein